MVATPAVPLDQTNIASDASTTSSCTVIAFPLVGRAEPDTLT